MSLSPVERTASGVCRQMLTFVLGNEDYGVDILRVQEIRGWSAVTRIPQSSPDVLGVLNLRGSVVPIVDLRLRLQLERAEYNAMTVIIVLMVESVNVRTAVGVVVDGVNEVIDVDASSLRPPPDFGTQRTLECVSGLLPKDERMIVLLDVDRLAGTASADAARAA